MLHTYTSKSSNEFIFINFWGLENMITYWLGGGGHSLEKYLFCKVAIIIASMTQNIQIIY